MLNTSNFVLTKHHLQKVSVSCFNWAKSVTEAHRKLVEVYGDTAINEKSCNKWSRLFKKGDFSIADKPRFGQPKKIEYKDL